MLICFMPTGKAALNCQHPFVLVNAEELAILRAQLAQPGWKSALYREPRGFSVMSSGRGVRDNADL